MSAQTRDVLAPHNLSTTQHSTEFTQCWLGKPGCRPDALLNVAWTCFVVGVFYVLGRLINGPDKQRRSVLLVIVALISHARDVVYIVTSTLPASVYVHVVVTVLLQVAAALISIAPQLRPLPPNAESHASFLKPMIFPCRTTHSRLFPQKHSFSYSYLLVGIPVHWKGAAGTLLSAGDTPSTSTWFTVSAEDYLARGKHEQGLQGKLADYLTAQGVSVDQYAHAYLVTAPRFLGFSFNPVSFWYLYGHDGQLAAMILEVNNTFDERRMYYMECENEQPEIPLKAFRTSWPKDFHVSPFNDRDGTYSLTAKDIRLDPSSSKLDNNIILLSHDGKPKVIARVYSSEHGLDPSDTSGIETWLFLIRWWWVGFMTNPRILREARLLWVKGLQVFYRPEVLRSSIGRNETHEETLIEPHFRRFLEKLIDAQEGSTTISYLAAAGANRGKTVDLENLRRGSSNVPARRIEVHALTPALYSEVVKFGSVEQAFSKVCFEPADGAAMMHCSDHGLLRNMVRDLESKQKPDRNVRPSRRAQFVSCLRRKGVLGTFKDFPRIARGGNQGKTHMSGLDRSVRDEEPPLVYKTYLQTVARVSLVDRLALGFGWIFDFYGQSVRLAVLWWTFHDTAVSAPQRSSISSTLLRLVLYVVIYHKADDFLTA